MRLGAITVRHFRRIVVVGLSVVGLSLAVIAVVASPIALWWGYDVWQDRQHAIAVREDTPVFAGAGDATCGGAQMTTISPGSKVDVRRIRIWKNCATIDVRLPDGRVGYIVYDGRQISVSPSLR